MTDKKSKSSNIILREDDRVLTKAEDVCEIFNDYFVNIASSIGFDDEIETVESSVLKHSQHPTIVKIKD